MKRLLIATTLAALALSGPAFADKGKDPYKHHQKAQEKAHKDYDKAQKKAYKEEQKAYKRWARGQHIPHEYLVSRYYIDDYSRYDLAPPPRGYRWVRPYEDDQTYYLVQIATGLISQIFGG